MKRFKNILVVYDVTPGCDDTLQRAVDLATRNRAHLTIVHAVNPLSDESQTMAERERLVARVTKGISLPAAQKSHIVRQGPVADSLLDLGREVRADLVVTPDTTKGFYGRLMGFDVSAELLQRAECPVWVVRPKVAETYRRIVAAVNVGKSDALTCPANRRILEIASSLAILERAELHLVYAWEYEGKERDMMTSELPRSKYQEFSNQARLRNLGLIVDLVEHVLEDFTDYTATPIRGDTCESIINYVEQQSADLLVIDGRIDGAIKSAVIENTTTGLLQRSSCSVLCTRPAPALQSKDNREAA